MARKKQQNEAPKEKISLRKRQQRATDIEAYEKMIKAVELRKKGYSHFEIAHELNCTIGRVTQHITNYLSKLDEDCKETAKEVLRMEMERLDGLLKITYERVMNDEANAAQLCQGIDRIIAVMNRRAKLLGLDAPQRVAPTTPEGDKPYQFSVQEMTDEQLENIVRGFIGETGSERVVEQEEG
jgi:gas vesicle protein